MWRSPTPDWVVSMRTGCGSVTARVHLSRAEVGLRQQFGESRVAAAAVALLLLQAFLLLL
jgi:hypothetical protein